MRLILTRVSKVPGGIEKCIARGASKVGFGRVEPVTASAEQQMDMPAKSASSLRLNAIFR